MEIGTSPRVTSSRKRITYKPSGWRVHQFEIWSGELVCRAAALRVEGALLLWVGGGGVAELTEVALGMPAREDGGCRAALASTLLGADGAAAALARRLSAALARPVYVCSGLVFDRFAMPLVERGLIAEIKSRSTVGESMLHIISRCSCLATGEYLHRYNLVARIIHQQLALKYSHVDLDVPYYRNVPDPVLENGYITLYWDHSIITDRTIMANKPDIVVIDRLEHRKIIVDIGSHDENLVKAEPDKQIKYLDLAREVADMWDVDLVNIVPIIVSTSGLIAKSDSYDKEVFIKTDGSSDGGCKCAQPKIPFGEATVNSRTRKCVLATCSSHRL